MRKIKRKRNTVKVIKASEAKNCDTWELPELKEHKIDLAVNVLPGTAKENESHFVNLLQDKIKLKSNSIGKEKSKKNVDKEHELIRKQGFDLGFTEGLQAGKERGLEEIKRDSIKIKTICKKFMEAFEDVNSQVVDNIQKLSVVIAEALVNMQLSISPKIIKNLVKDALRMLPRNSKNVSVFVSKHDYSLLKSLKLDKDFVQYENLNIIADKKLKAGGYKVITPITTIDSTFEKKLRKILSDLNDKSDQ